MSIIQQYKPNAGYEKENKVFTSNLRYMQHKETKHAEERQ